MWDLSTYIKVPLDLWIQQFVMDWLVPHFRPTFRTLQWPVALLLDRFNTVLLSIPFPMFLIVVAAGIWRLAGARVAVFSAVSLVVLDILGLWQDAMTTLAMICTAVVFCTAIGIPTGILAARNDRVSMLLRPALDIMQTIPSFVYLVPIVMLFGVGLVPGTIATIVFGLPPIIRLTELGIRQVPAELVEAAVAFGSTSRQVLREVEIPLAMPTIMVGLNQTLMMSLSMVVIAALIGAGGLGVTVYTGIGRLDVGSAALGGIGIVILAIILDRTTQSLAGHRDGHTVASKHIDVG
jgi:glycine betaine/proline transport system permease protein